ncbi:MAG: hypothetical protein WDO24_17750 [Pseudomonadota bacterium]
MEQELVGVIVADHDPDVRLFGRQPLADLARLEADALDRRLVLGVGQGEELRRMRHQHAADDAARHWPAA